MARDDDDSGHDDDFSNKVLVRGNYYNMTVWILARNDINLSMAAGLIRLHMPGVK